MIKLMFLLFFLFSSALLMAQQVPMNKDTKAVFDNIFSRKSVRVYKTDAKGERIPISKDTLEVIVKAGMAAPTAMNKQPWEFVV